MTTPQRRHPNDSPQSLVASAPVAKTHTGPGLKKKPIPPEIPNAPDVSELAEFDALEDIFPWPISGRGAR